MGQELWFSIPKDGISLLKIRSKIEHQGVREKAVNHLIFSLFLFFRVAKGLPITTPPWCPSTALCSSRPASMPAPAPTSMPTPAKAHMVKDCIVAKFGMNMYYRMRRGERLITPTEQEELYQLLEQQGVKTRPEFDAYVEDYLW